MMDRKLFLEKFFPLLLALLFMSSTNLLSQPVQADWEKRYNGPWGLVDFGRQLKISNDGFVYVAGHSFVNPSEGVTTIIKYGPDGTTIWEKNTAVGDNMEEIYVDDSGNIYSIGDWWNGSDFDILVIKFDTAGNQLWRKTFDGGFWDRGNSVRTDSQGNVYVVGHTWFQPEFYNIVLVKFDSMGEYQWNKTFSSDGQHFDWGHKVMVDQSDNIYVTGYAYTDMVLLKYSPSGDTLWQRSYNTNSEWDEVTDNYFDFDNNGNIVLCGNYYSASTRNDILILKYDASGNLLWDKKWNSPNNVTDMVNFEFPDENALSVHTDGSIFVTGTTLDSNVSFGENIATVKYSPDGVMQWQNIYDGPANDWDWPHSIALDSKGDVYVTGATVEFVNSLVPLDYLTMKLDGSNGSLVWKETYNGLGDFADESHAMAVDKEDNVYVTGITQNDDIIGSSNNDIVTIKYTQNTVGITGNNTVPDKFALEQNYPNPFNPSTNIRFDIPKAGFVKLAVYDILGKEVSVLINGYKEAGSFEVQFNASGLPSGVYFYKLTTEGFTEIKKMALIK